MKASVITEAQVRASLPPRLPDSHKGTYGRLIAVCGSSAFRGAASLCVEGALRMGAGIVTLASTERVIASVLAKRSECTCAPLPENESGGIAEEAGGTLYRLCRASTAVLCGCGMGNTPDTLALATLLLRTCPVPVLLDADALNVLAPDHSPLLAPHPPLVLTPHIGEAARLTGKTAEEIKADPAGTALGMAQRFRCTLVLKDHVTTVASPSGEVWENRTGNAGLARGGSGDLLAGMIASLLAQGTEPTAAALCGVYLHGRAADLCAAERSMTGMLPSDAAEYLCRIFREWNR